MRMKNQGSVFSDKHYERLFYIKGGIFMFCSKCGKELEQDAKFCPACGTNLDQEAQANESQIHQHEAGPSGETSPKGATAALVCGIIGIVMSFIIPLVGLILSLVAISQGIKANKVSKTGIATAGYIMGIAGIILSIIMWVLSAVMLASLIF